MHLQQTKSESLRTGGPQYYLQDMPRGIHDYLRYRHACPVILQTPYGITSVPFTAVDRDHKLGPKGQILPG